MNGDFRAMTHFSHFVIAEIIECVEQKPLPLFLGAKGQYGHDLIKSFPPANHILWGGTIWQAALSGNYVLVPFPSIPIPLLLTVKFPAVALFLFPKLPNLGRDFNGHYALISFDGNFHLAFSFRSVLLGLNEGAGSGIGVGVSGSIETQKHPDGARPFGCWW